MAARGAGTRAVVEERLQAKGIVLQNVVDFGNTEGVKRQSKRGWGYQFNPGVSPSGRSLPDSWRAFPWRGWTPSWRTFAFAAKTSIFPMRRRRFWSCCVP